MATLDIGSGTKHAAARSPFRYPGGKAWLANVLEEELQALAPLGGTYLEPYAGGAGAAIRLLASGAANEVHLNDADPRVYCAWQALLFENDRFLEQLETVETTIGRWWEFKRLVDNPSLAAEPFDLGFAAFYLNRTNRSGILQGAAPIGGYEQSGDWKLDARFYRKTLFQRVEWIGKNAHRIHLTKLDGLCFLKQSASSVQKGALYFIDPPYVAAGSRLYMNGMTTKDHRGLGEFLCSGDLKHWILTYDDCALVREIYAAACIEKLGVRYTLQNKRNDSELIIRPLKPNVEN